jgi:large conductance mechanosensitive channel
MSFVTEFMEFIKKQNIVSVALGLIIGFASLTLVNALVADLISPIYSPYLTFLNPDTAITVGLSNFMVGHFIQALISFLVILLIAFVISKMMAKNN